MPRSSEYRGQHLFAFKISETSEPSFMFQIEQEMCEVGVRLRESEKEKMKLQFELEKVKQELEAVTSSVQSHQAATLSDGAESADELEVRRVQKFEAIYPWRK